MHNQQHAAGTVPNDRHATELLIAAHWLDAMQRPTLPSHAMQFQAVPCNAKACRAMLVLLFMRVCSANKQVNTVASTVTCQAPHGVPDSLDQDG